jgi:hypothetical protein
MRNAVCRDTLQVLEPVLCCARVARPGSGPVVREGVRFVTTIERSIKIEAPVKKVWDYVDDPLHLLEIWPSMVRSRT